MNKVKTHTFNGIKYVIDIGEPVDGICTSPRSNDKVIIIGTVKKTKKELVAILHEALHAEGWSTSEEVVDRVSTEIGNLLWRLNYRRT